MFYPQMTGVIGGGGGQSCRRNNKVRGGSQWSEDLQHITELNGMLAKC